MAQCCWTGFSAFGVGEERIEANPTSVLAEALGRDAQNRSVVLEVSMEACSGLGALAEEVVVHLGFARCEQITLERVAYNDASFRHPDERGAQPWQQCIDGEEHGAAIFSDVDVGAVAAELKRHGHDVAVSDDPGRFVCGFLYYKSMRARPGKKTLFVHCPSFEVLSFDEQLATLKCLRTALCGNNDLVADLIALGIAPSSAEAAKQAGLTTVESAVNFIFNEPDPDQELKMVVLARTDLAMSRGKIAAQACHAALGAYRATLDARPDRALAWLDQGEKLVVLEATGDASFLHAKEAAAKAARLPTCLVADAGRTEVLPGTETVLAVGPGPADAIDRISGQLHLLQ